MRWEPDSVKEQKNCSTSLSQCDPRSSVHKGNLPLIIQGVTQKSSKICHLVQHFLQCSHMTRSTWKCCVINRKICQGFTWSFYFIPWRTGLCYTSKGDKLLRCLQIVMSSRNHTFSKTFMGIYISYICLHMPPSSTEFYLWSSCFLRAGRVQIPPPKTVINVLRMAQQRW